MGQIQDLSDLINKFTGGASGAPESLFFYKNGRIAGAAATAPIAGRMMSAWTYEGYPAAGPVPTTASAIDTSSIGSIYLAEVSAGFEKYLIQAAAACTQAGTVILYDRLFQEGGYNATATTVTDVQGNPPSPVITRNVSGEGNFVFYEIHTIIGTTQTTITMEYKNQDGNIASGTATIGGTGFREVTRAQLFSLSGSDHGVQCVTKFRLAGTTGTAGNFSIVIGKPLAYIPIGNAGSMGWRDFTTGLPAIPKLTSGAALGLLFIPFTTTVPDFFGCISTIQA